MWTQTQRGEIVYLGSGGITRICAQHQPGGWQVVGTLANGGTVTLCDADHEADARHTVELISRGLASLHINTIIDMGARRDQEVPV